MEESITEILEQVKYQMCDKYCRWSTGPIPDGKDEDWLLEDPDSPCNGCPLNRL